MSLLAAKGLSVRLGGAEILSGVSLALNPAEIVTIVGPNGSGKSTLLRALLGLIPAAAGTVTRAKNLRIGYVPQRLHIDRPMPITARRFLSLPKRCTDAQAAEVLARCGVSDVGAHQLADLSGGQLQRVLLARALLNQPDVLILDEPTQGLDQPGEAAFYQLIEEVRHDTGAAVLLVSHDLHVVMAASDRVICLNGHICCEGAPDVVRDAPEYRALFGAGTQGALALYRHDHDHDHVHGPGDAHAHVPGCGHDHGGDDGDDHWGDHDHAKKDAHEHV
jgi:zinc transport system ATP-binding protein